MQKNVSAVIAPADVQAVITLIQKADAMLPFLISLSEEERIELTKLGSKSVDFVGDASETVKAFPQILPPTFDKLEFTKDVDLIKNMLPIYVIVEAFLQKLDDTMMEVGSEAMTKALEVYALVQLQKDNVPGLRGSYDRLKVRF